MKKTFLTVIVICLFAFCMTFLAACDLQPAGHEHQLTKHNAVAASCDVGGSAEYFSCDCGKFFSDAEGKTEIANQSWILPALNHNMSEFVFNNDAACGVDGTKTSHCQNEGCDVTITETAANSALKHDFKKYVNDNNATCDANGTETATCANEGCDETDTREIANSKLVHKLGADEYLPANCTEYARKANKCTQPGCDYAVYEYYEELGYGHFWDDGVLTKHTTATTNGVMTFTCSECGETRTEEVLPYEGTYVDTLDALVGIFNEGGTVVLNSDIVTDKNLQVPAGKTVVLNLNGYMLSGAFANQGTSALIDNRGTLTILNGKVVSLAQFPDVDWGEEGFPTYATNTISNRGVLTIEKHTIIENETNKGGASYAIDNYDGATLTVNGGKIIAKDVAIRQFSNSITTTNTVIINDGEISGVRAIWVHVAGSNPARAAMVSLTINGGVLTSTTPSSTGDYYVLYSYSFGGSFSEVNISITGGVFKNGYVAFGGGYKGDKENVTITGGIYEQDVFRFTSDGTELLLLGSGKIEG